MTAPTHTRIASLDSLRGLLLILMIFEHTRQILTGIVFVETWGAPATASDLAGIIRGISHICAPGFFLLMGMGVVLKARAGASFGYFLRRGLLLVLLQFTLENFAWGLTMPGEFSLGSVPIHFGVLSALGAGMIICAAIRKLPRTLLAAFAFYMLIPSHLISHDTPGLLSGLLTRGLYEGRILVYYPALPWTGFALIGVGLARDGILKIRLKNSALVFLFVSGFLGLLFWSSVTLAPPLEKTAFCKYPPAEGFIFISLSVIFIIIAALEQFRFLNAPFLQRFGRHSLTIYLLHLYILAALAAFVAPVSAWQSLYLATGLCAVLYFVCVWRDKHKADAFGALAPGYDAFMRLFGFYNTAALEKFLPAPDPQTPPRALLDVAGGTGWMTARLAPKFRRAVVLDISEGMLRKARRRGIETVRGSALEMPFPDATFDVVLCTDALHHIKNLDRAVAEMARVVKPDGTILIQEFHIRNFAGRLLRIFERLFIDSPRYITPDELRGIVLRHGFSAETHAVSRMEYVCACSLKPLKL